MPGQKKRLLIAAGIPVLLLCAALLVLQSCELSLSCHNNLPDPPFTEPDQLFFTNLSLTSPQKIKLPVTIPKIRVYDSRTGEDLDVDVYLTRLADNHFLYSAGYMTLEEFIDPYQNEPGQPQQYSPDQTGGRFYQPYRLNITLAFSDFPPEDHTILVQVHSKVLGLFPCMVEISLPRP